MLKKIFPVLLVSLVLPAARAATPLYLIQNSPDAKPTEWIVEYDEKGQGHLLSPTDAITSREALLSNTGEFAHLNGGPHKIMGFWKTDPNLGMKLALRAPVVFNGEIAGQPVSAALDTKRNRLVVLQREDDGREVLFEVLLNSSDPAGTIKLNRGDGGPVEILNELEVKKHAVPAPELSTTLSDLVYDSATDAFYSLGKEKEQATSIYRLAPDFSSAKKVFSVGDKISSVSNGIEISSPPRLAIAKPGVLWAYSSVFGHGREIQVFKLQPESGPERIASEIITPAIPPKIYAKDWPGTPLLTLERGKCYRRGDTGFVWLNKYSNAVVVSVYGAAASQPRIRVTLPKSGRPLELLLAGNHEWEIVNPSHTKLAAIYTRDADGKVTVKGDTGGAAISAVGTQGVEMFDCLEADPTYAHYLDQATVWKPLLAYVGTRADTEITLPPLDTAGAEPGPDDSWKKPDHDLPSFVCAKAKSGVEKMICADTDLSGFDVQMAKEYQAYLAAAPKADRAVIIKDQHDWLKSRDECKDKECLQQSMLGRKRELVYAGRTREDRKAYSDLSLKEMREIAADSSRLLLKKYPDLATAPVMPGGGGKVAKKGPDHLLPFGDDSLTCMGHAGNYTCRAFYQGCASAGGGGRCCSGFDVTTERAYDGKILIRKASRTTLEEACRALERAGG